MGSLEQWTSFVLREKTLVFVINNSLNSRMQCAKKFHSLWISADEVGAVVVGIDPRFNCYKLQYGTLCMREKPGCIFIATNRDPVGRKTDL